MDYKGTGLVTGDVRAGFAEEGDEGVGRELGGRGGEALEVGGGELGEGGGTGKEGEGFGVGVEGGGGVVAACTWGARTNVSACR